MEKNEIIFRQDVRGGDASGLRDIVESTGFFNQEEIDVAVELVTERLEKGEASGYYFIFADFKDRTIGYACYGPIPGTQASFDLYWIAVHRDYRGKGIGKLLLNASEQEISRMGGRRIYIETASRKQYTPTRAFYLACQYELEATLRDFYAPGDSKCIFVKEIHSVE